MRVFNLMEMADKYEPFNVWNKKIKKLEPDLVHFMLSLGEIENEPEYEAPSSERLKEALMIVANHIHKYSSEFVEALNVPLNEEASSFPAWAFCGFLNSYFVENVPCDDE